MCAAGSASQPYLKRRKKSGVEPPHSKALRAEEENPELEY